MTLHAKKDETADDGLDFPEAERGFTLVELAIVLVVIGLIVAAVLKGQELVETARLKSTISDIAGVRSATATFRDKYHGLPGDFVEAQARLGDPAGVVWASCDGATDCDGDDVIDGDGVSGETLLFWNHLSAANMLSTVSPLGAASFGDGLPAAPVGGGLTVRYEQVGTRTAHWMTLGSAAATPTGVLDAEQAMAVDEKADDGRPGTGSVRTVTAACTDVVPPATVDGTSAYDPDPAVTGCVVKFEL